MTDTTSTAEQALNVAVAASASKISYLGSGASIASGLLSNEFGVLAGLVVAAAGLAINWYYKAKEDRRAQREEARQVREHRRLMKDSEPPHEQTSGS